MFRFIPLSLSFSFTCVFYSIFTSLLSLSGGEVYLYQATSPATRNDWRSDGHRWENNGTSKLPRSRPIIAKIYFYLKKDNLVSKDFTKSVFMLPNPDSPNPRLLIHYQGDEKLSVAQAHGNAKVQTKLSFRTQPSTLKSLEKRAQGADQPGKIYKEEVAKQTEANAVIAQPRNLKQVQNMKAKTVQDNRLSRDAITNVHELAYSAPGFVRYISTFPDLVVVVGTPDMTNELNDVLKLKSMDQLLSYDTTFSLGEFYVSPLLFRHIAFNDNPILLAGCLIHERKFQAHHEIFFKTILKGVQHGKSVPIVTDEEAALINAIETSTNLVRLGCHLNDIS